MTTTEFVPIPAHSDGVTKVLVEPGVLLTTSLDHTVRLYDLLEGALPALRQVFTHTERAWCMALSERHVATGTASGVIHLWDRHAGTLVRRIEGPPSAILSLVFHGDELVTSSVNWTITRWELATGRCLETRRWPGRWSPCFAADGGTFYIAEHGAVLAVELDTGAQRTLVPSDGDDVTGLLLSGQRLVVSYAEVSNSPSPPYSWSSSYDAQTGAHLDGHDRDAAAFAFSPDFRLALQLHDAYAVLQRQAPPSTAWHVLRFPELPTCAAFTDDSHVVVGGAGGSLFLVSITP